MKVTALRGNARIATCTTSFSLRSPLVLLWPEAPSGDSSTPFRIQTSLTRFDIDGDGVKEPMGWVAGKAGFLALDLNGNDIIDDGRELFGDATMLLAKDGMHAVNGFEALAQYDDNQDSVIDQKDAVMSRLIVWFDSDSDGDSDPSELVPIAMMGVERIDLRYQSVREGPQGSGGLVQARYEARFFGKDLCNGAGCPVYDLYFAKGSSKEASTGSLDVGGRPQ
jgi:hypothetical protein